MRDRYDGQLKFEIMVDQCEVLNRLNPLLVDQSMQREPAYNICPRQTQPVIYRSSNQHRAHGTIGRSPAHACHHAGRRILPSLTAARPTICVAASRIKEQAAP